MEKIKAEIIKECPHCGHNIFYRKAFISGKTNIYYRFGFPLDDSGEMSERGKWTGADNSSMYEFLDTKENKTAYCEQCHKKI